MNLKECVRKLEALAPTSLAGSWDNVGLLVQPPQTSTVSKMLLTNDLTDGVLEEALSIGADFILSYHPPIFKGLKTIGQKTWKERIIGKCLAHGIAVFSPHTSYDALVGGVNDWLVSAFGMGNVSPIEQAYENSKWGYQIQLSTENPQFLMELTNQVQQAFEENVRCTADSRVTLSIMCHKGFLSQVIYFVRQGGFIIPDSLAVTELLAKIPIYNCGMGRKKVLASPITLSEAVSRVKDHLSLPHVRLAVKNGGNSDSVVETVAVCAGAGRSVLCGVEADIYVTGEMSHHDILDATHCNTSVILTEHSNCERGFLKLLKPRLSVLFENNIEIFISNVDSDPLKVV